MRAAELELFAIFLRKWSWGLKKQWLSGEVFDPRPLREIAVALFGQERSPQSPQQGANFRLRPAVNSRHQKSNKKNMFLF